MSIVRTSAPVACLLTAALFSLAGCGAGGIAAALSGGGGGGGSAVKRIAPPIVSVAPLTAPNLSNYITIAYSLRDPRIKPDDDDKDDLRVAVRPQFRILPDRGPPPPGDDGWMAMTEGDLAGPDGDPLSDGTRGVALGDRTFVWNSALDLAPRVVPALDLQVDAPIRVQVRVLADYEPTAGVSRRFRIRGTEFEVDNRLAGTLFGGENVAPTDVDTFPVDLRPNGDTLFVVAFGANIVESVNPLGRTRREVGFGVPGTTAPEAHPGVARLETLISAELDADGNVYTNHTDAIRVANLGFGPLRFGDQTVPPRTIALVSLDDGAGDDTVQGARSARFDPVSGAFLFLNRGDRLEAYNPQDPLAPGATSLVLAGVTIPPGERRTVLGGLSAPVGIAVGPSGEYYVAERGLFQVTALNPTAAPIVLGGQVVAPGATAVVAGGNGQASPGRSGDLPDDGAPAVAAQLGAFQGIGVSGDSVLFIADTSQARVRAVNLSPVARTFAGTTIQPGDIETVVGGGVGGVGSRATSLDLDAPNAISIDDQGHALVADGRSVILVNDSDVTITRYGKTAGPGRTAEVYDAVTRGGVPLSSPRGLLAQAVAPEGFLVYTTDRSTVRVTNLTPDPIVIGPAAVQPGETELVAGGAIPGRSGDGGLSNQASLNFPSAVAGSGPFTLFVADTDNDRIRVLNVSDPRLGQSQLILGKTIQAGGIATVIGGAIGPLPGDGDGNLADNSTLDGPRGVAVGPDGLIYVSDSGNHRIRVVNPLTNAQTVGGVVVQPGTIETVIGTGVPGFTPDGPGTGGGNAVSTPAGIAIDNQNVLYFAEVGNARIRALNLGTETRTRAGVDVPVGGLRTIVGTGIRGNSGDGGLAPDASIDSPNSLLLQTESGVPVSLYFADTEQHVVRMVNLTDVDRLARLAPDGTVDLTVPAASIVSLAGGPNALGVPNAPAFAGDGRDPSDVRFAAPWGVAITTIGGLPANFLVGDGDNDRLRRFGAPPNLEQTE